MTGPVVTSTVRVIRDWRSWPTRLATLWRRSLRFRTVLLTVGLTALAILVACVGMALAIQNDLFQSRLNQVLESSQNATIAAQKTLESTVDTGESAVTRQNLLTSIQQPLLQQASSDVFAFYRIGTDISPLAPQNQTSRGFDESILSPGLREQVQNGDSGSQWWQSVALPTSGGGTVPGIVVGQQLEIPDVGPYELYLAYDFASPAQTLSFVQFVLWMVGIVLLILIGGIAWYVLRSVTTPIGEAADTSAKLASGDLGVRLDVRGDDELATLGRSFNAMADSIQSQIKELADLSLVQQRFVSDVSHELRTPLTTIRLAADMLNDRRDDFDPATARAAELLHAQVQRFETLLTDLLEISRYDAGSVQLELEPTSLAHLAEDVIASMSQLAQQHGSDVRLVAPGGYSPVEMDPRRIRRIVRNLLGNAIEHGEGRPIVITVDSDQRTVALGVLDYGMGMLPADAERVFDRFWRADPSRKRTIGGTGLGLSIALGDARLHGGTLAVWSEPGRGSHFVLTLPRDGSRVEGSPIPLAPREGEVAPFGALGLTQPIHVSDGAS
jgi:two-component system sensor histidine kinase MtrB